MGGCSSAGQAEVVAVGMVYIAQRQGQLQVTLVTRDGVRTRHVCIADQLCAGERLRWTGIRRVCGAHVAG